MVSLLTVDIQTVSYVHLLFIPHYSTFFGATVLREVLDICPYSSLLVVATKKRGIMPIPLRQKARMW